MKFFTIDHGADNYEEWIDLDKIVFIRCLAKYNPEWKYCAGYEDNKIELADSDISVDFDYVATITFDCGAQEKIHFSALGWHELTKAMRKL